MPIMLRHSCPYHVPCQTHDVFFNGFSLPKNGRRIAYKCPDSGKEVVVTPDIPFSQVTLIPQKPLVGYVR